ncbi:MAG: phosphoribosylaminoimidazole (AIR) synthetase, partial [Myxococcota bacterium]
FNLGLGMLWVIPKDDVARFVEAVPEAIVVAEITERDTAPVVFHG